MSWKEKTRAGSPKAGCNGLGFGFYPESSGEPTEASNLGSNMIRLHFRIITLATGWRRVDVGKTQVRGPV